MLDVRPSIRRVKVWSRNFSNATRFVEHESSRSGIEVKAFQSGQEAASGADIVCTTTGSTSPVLKGDWLKAGAHVNAVGASRELDTKAVAMSRFFVDSRESAFAEADDFLIPRGEGAIGDDHILGELGDLLLGRVVGRSAPSDVTVFKSVGLAVEDLFAAHHVYNQALSRNLGTWVDFSSFRNSA
jgi:ornithine cyclodeaminase